MGASGSAWIKPKKRTGLRPALFADVPHPRFARPGQRFFPLASRAASPSTLVVLRSSGEQCEVRRESDSKRMRVRAERLLAAQDDGSGRHYRFIGFAQRTGYQTVALVLSVDDTWTRLALPEWHPGVAAAVATGAVPATLRTPGTWLSCRADLGADAAARLQVREIGSPDGSFDPDRYHDVTLEPEAAGTQAPAPDAKPADARDVVLFLAADELDEALADRGGVYVTGHSPTVRAGARAYLHVDGGVRGWRTVRRVRPLPSGTRIELEGDCNPASIADAPNRPVGAVADGRHGQQRWALWP